MNFWTQRGPDTRRRRIRRSPDGQSHRESRAASTAHMPRAQGVPGLSRMATRAFYFDPLNPNPPIQADPYGSDMILPDYSRLFPKKNRMSFEEVQEWYRGNCK